MLISAVFWPNGFLSYFRLFDRKSPPAREALVEEKHKSEDTVSRTASAYRRAAPILDAVWQLVAASMLGTLAGWWLDGQLKTTPWLLIAGALLGIGSGMYAFLRAALAVSKKPPKR